MAKACYFTPNGQRSNVYDTLSESHNELVAKNFWHHMHTFEFMKEFGNWQLTSANIEAFPRDLDRGMAQGLNRDVSSMVDENGEPAIFYLKKVHNGYVEMTRTPRKGARAHIMITSDNRVDEIPKGGMRMSRAVASAYSNKLDVIKRGDYYFVLNPSILRDINPNGTLNDTSVLDVNTDDGSHVYEALLNKLSAKFNIDYEIDPSITGSGKFENGKVYVNPANMSMATPFHEFMHPFLLAIQQNNKAVYDNLVEELYESEHGRQILLQIQNNPNYSRLSKADQINEAIVRVTADLATQPELQAKNEGFWAAVLQLLAKVAKWINQAMNPSDTINVKNLHPETTLKDLAVILNMDNEVDLGSYETPDYALEETDDTEEVEEDNATLEERVASFRAAFAHMTFKDNPIIAQGSGVTAGTLKVDPYSNTYVKAHTYLSRGTPVEMSVTELVGEDNEFDIENYMRTSRSIRKQWGELADKGITVGSTYTDTYQGKEITIVDNADMIQFLLTADPVRWTDTWENEYIPYMKEKYGDDVVYDNANEDAKNMFKNLYYRFKSWGAMREAGSDMHAVMEAVFAEQADRTAEHTTMLALLEKAEKDIEDGVDVPSYVKIRIAFRDQIQKIKDYIHSKGGAVIVEPILHSKRALSNKKGIVDIAGRPDAIAIYPDGTAEIYDLKTMMWKPQDTRTFDASTTDVEGRVSYSGYNWIRKQKHSRQMSAYKRIIEKNTGIKIKEITAAYIIPFHVQETRDINAKGSQSAPTGRSKHVVEKGSTVKFSKENTKVGDEKYNAGLDFIIDTKAFDAQWSIYTNGEKYVAAKIEFEEYKGGSSSANKAEQEKFDRRNDFYTTENFDPKLNQTILDLRTYIRQKIEELERSKKRDERTAAEKKTLRTLESDVKFYADLTELNKIDALYQYVIYVYNSMYTDQFTTDRFGNQVVVPGLESVIMNIKKRWRDSDYFSHSEGENTRLAIQDIDDLRRQLKSFDLLDEIADTLNSAPPQVKEQIENSEFYKKLHEVRKDRRLLIAHLDELGRDILAEILYDHRNRSMQDEVEKTINPIIRRRTLELEKLEAQEAQGIDNSRKIENINKQLEALRRQRINMLGGDKETSINNIKEELEQLDEDIGVIHRHVISATTASNKVIGLFTRTLKDALNQADLRTQREGVEMQKIYDDIIKKLTTVSPDKYGLNKLDGIFKEMLEPVTIIRRNRDKYERVQRWSLVAPYDMSYKNELRVLQIQRDAAVNEGIILDDDLNPVIDPQTGEVKKSNPEIQYKLTKKLQEWRFENLAKEFKPEYYEYLEVLKPNDNDDDVTAQAKREITEELERISEATSLIYSRPDDLTGTVDAYKILSDRDNMELYELNLRRRKLASMYDDDGNMKTDVELRKAELMTEHNKKFNEVHNFDVNYERYQKMLQIVTGKYKDYYPNNINVNGQEVPEWSVRVQAWKDANTSIVFSEDFEEKMKYLSIRRKAILFLDKLWIFRYEQEQKLQSGEIDELSYTQDDLSNLRSKIFSALSEPTYADTISSIESAIIDSDVEGIHNFWVEFDNEWENLNSLLRPYYVDNGLYNTDAIKDNDVLVRRIKEIQEWTEGNKIEDESLKHYWREFSEQYFKEIGFPPIPQYYDELAKAQALVDNGQYQRVEETPWFEANHYLAKTRDGYERRPLRFWTKMMPTAIAQKIQQRTSNLKMAYLNEKVLEMIDIDRKYRSEELSDFDVKSEDGYDDAYSSLKSNESIYDSVWYNEVVLPNKLKESKWYKKAHLYDDNNNPILNSKGEHEVSNKYKAVINEDSHGNIINTDFKVIPSGRYRVTKPKQEYVKNEEELKEVFDNRGTFMPAPEHYQNSDGKWANQKYWAMRNREGEEGRLLNELYDRITKIYFQDQENFAPTDRLNYLIPGERRRLINLTRDDRGKMTAASWRKGAGEWVKEKFKESIITLETDVEDRAPEGTVPRKEFDNRILRTLVPTETPMEDVELDLMRSLFIHKNKSLRWKAKNDLLPTIRTLMDVIKTRDKDPNRGTKIKDAKGRSILHRIYHDVVGRPASPDTIKVLSSDGQSLQYLLLKDFIEMQVFGERNIAVESAIDMSSYSNSILKTKWGEGFSRLVNLTDDSVLRLRWDKLFDSIRGLASLTQVGGFYSAAFPFVSIPGIMKGAANWMNAQYQEHLAAWAGKHMDGEDFWQAAKYMPTLTREVFEDWGKVTNTTFSGQMFDIYEPVQGDDFTNNIGEKVRGNARGIGGKSIFYYDTLFFFQHTGEWQAGMHLLYAMMHSHRVDQSGNVISKSQFLSKKLQLKNQDIQNKEKWVPLSLKEQADAAKEFTELPTLLSKHRMGEDGILRIGAGVRFGERYDITNSQEFKDLSEKKKNKTLTDEESSRYKELLQEVKESNASFNDFKNKLHELSMEMHGNYKKFTTPVAKRNFIVRTLFQYKDFFIPQFQRRFATLRPNYHLGQPTYGFHRHFYKLLFSDFRRTTKAMGDIMVRTINKNREGQTDLSELELQNIRQSMYEHMAVMVLIALIWALEPPEGEDKKEISLARWIFLYELARLKQEIGAMTPTHMMVTENWKMLNSPFSLYNWSKRVLAVFAQGFSDAGGIITGEGIERYKRDYGLAIEKGDSKFKIRIQKMFGNFGITDPRVMYENFERNDF